MKHFHILLLVAIAGSCFAAPLTPEQALVRMRGAQEGARYAAAAKPVYVEAKAEQPAYYVFARDNGGFVIASGDDLAAPVLGYSNSAWPGYDALPVQLKEWLKGYADEIQWARCQPLPASGERMAAQRPQRTAIPLMVHAHWDQDAPFNNKCPVKDGTRCPTGCVATAIAQIMRFWQYPAKGQGTNSYSWNNTTLSMDFSTVKFDWKNMPYILTDSWTEDQNNAVATLMQACGYAMDMDYDTSASGAVTAYAADRLVRYFDYAPSSTHYDRSGYGLFEWEDMVYGSLAADCPVLYHGSGSSGGHAFVVDGYESDGYFHLNWGWGGVSNGYFLLTALEPANFGIGGGAGGFNTGQGAVLNLRPNFEGSTPEYIITAQEYTTTLSVDAISFKGGFWNYGGATIPRAAFGAILEDANGNTRYLHYYTFSNLIQYRGLREYSVLVPSNLPDGQYTVNPAYAYSSTGEGAAKMPAPSSCKDHYVLTADNGSYTLNKLSDAEVTGTALKLGPKVYLGAKSRLEATITNSNPVEVYKNIYLGWFNASSDSFMGVGDAMLTDIPAETTVTWDKSIKIPSRVYSTPFSSYIINAPLTCKVALMVKDPESTNNAPVYIPITDKVEVSILSGSPTATLTSSNLTVENASSVNSMDVALDFDLKCTSGYFANNISVFVLDGNGKSKINYNTPDHYLNAGESKHVRFRFPFPAGEAQQRYQVLLNYKQSPSSGNSYLDNAYFTVGTTGVATIEGSAKAWIATYGSTAVVSTPQPIGSVEVYDMQGMRRNVSVEVDGTRATLEVASLTKGIYLVRVNCLGEACTLRLVKP